MHKDAHCVCTVGDIDEFGMYNYGAASMVAVLRNVLAGSTADTHI